MKRLKTLASVMIFVALLAFSITAQAEMVFNQWVEFAFPVADDSGCAGEDGVAAGVARITETSFKKGWSGFHVNAKGIWKGNDSGVELMWKDNVADVVPIGDFGTHFVGTISQSLKIIGGPAGQFRLKANVHLTEVNGEFVVYFDEVTTSCKI